MGGADSTGAILPGDQRGFVQVGRCDGGAFEAGSRGDDPLIRDGFEGP